MKKFTTFMLITNLVLVCSLQAFGNGDTLLNNLGKALIEAENSAVKDANGSITHMSIQFPNTKQVIALGYEQNRLSTITIEKVTTKVLYNENGCLAGYILPDKTKVLVVRDKVMPSNFPGVRIITSNGTETNYSGENFTYQNSPLNNGLQEAVKGSSLKPESRYVTATSVFVNLCQHSIRLAAYYTATAGLYCASGEYADCAGWTILAIRQWNVAYEICNSQSAPND